MSTIFTGSRKRSLMSRLGAAAVAIGTAVALAACASGSTPAPAPDAPAEGETVSIKVGVPPSIFAASINLGLTSGIFEEAGFDVELVTMQSAAEGLPQLMSGDLQYAIIESHAAFQSVSEGIPVQISAPIANYATEPPADGIGFGNMLVLEDSGINSPQDLAGKTIGTNTIGGAAYMSYYSALEQAGVDMTTVQWVEIPGPRQVPALRQGQVDAITVAEPQGTLALSEGGVKVAMNADNIRNGAPQFALSSTTQWLAENEEAAKRFMEALVEANNLAVTDRPALNEAIASYMDLPPEIIEQVRIPSFATEWWTPEDLAPIVDMINEFELIEPSQVPAPEDVIVQFD